VKEDWSQFRAFLREIFKVPGKQSCEVRVRRNTGEPLWVAVCGRGGRVEAPDGQLTEFLLALFDITHRKRLEEALRESNKRPQDFSSKRQEILRWAEGDY
jgi:PAS domain S-box-containing protein